MIFDIMQNIYILNLKSKFFNYVNKWIDILFIENYERKRIFLLIPVNIHKIQLIKKFINL